MAPEMLIGNSADVGKPADIYSFSIVLWELGTGMEPYEGDKFRSIQELITEVGRNHRRPQIPPGKLCTRLQDVIKVS
jgi:serine/threonine protein kinase